MSIVVYQCDTCKRELDILRNERGLDTVSRCVITQGCKGSLYQIDEKGTGVFGRPLTDVDGLDNYRQRNVLYIHEQLLSSSSWTIEHGLNSNPSVVVYLDNVTVDGVRSSTILDMDDYVVNFVDGNNITIQFAVGSTGIAHIISRSSNPDTVNFIQQPNTFDQLTANSVLTIGLPFVDDDPKTTDILLNFISPSTSNITSLIVEFTSHNFNGEISLFNTPWQDTDLIYTNGQIYKLKSVRVDSIMSSQDIESGSPFFFDDTNFIILTSNPPYSSLNVDINDTRVYIPSKIESSGVGSNTSGNDGEFFIDETTAINLHPPIKIIKTIFG
jgi:hypothetical protein